MDDDATGAHQSPDREDASLIENTDCPECGRRLADHGLATAGPGRTRLAPCGLDVAGVTLREVAFVLDDGRDHGARRVAADGGREEGVSHETNCAACGVHPRADGSRYCSGCYDALAKTDGGESA